MHIKIQNYKAHLMEFKVDAAIDHVGHGFTIEHAHVILVLKALDLGARHTLCPRLVPYVHRVIHARNGLGCVAHCERVHFRAQANELDNRIPFGLIFEVPPLFRREDRHDHVRG